MNGQQLYELHRHSVDDVNGGGMPGWHSMTFQQQQPWVKTATKIDQEIDGAIRAALHL